MEPIVETVLKELLASAGIPNSGIVRSEIAGQTVLSISTDDARALIGAHGDTVFALDHLVKKIAEKRLTAQAGSPAQASGGPSGQEGGPDDKEPPPRFLIDVNDYRTKQIKDLQIKALMMAERARSFQYDVELSPMSGYERLIIHTTLQDAPHVKTESQGEGHNRRVVIRYTT